MILRAGFRSTWAAVAFYAGMLVFVVLTLFPLVWVFKMSIVTQSELFQTPPTILPQKIITDNYERVFNDVRFQKGVINSVVIAGFTTVLHRLHSRLRDCSDQVSLQGARARPCAGDRFLPRRGHPGAVVPAVHELRDRQHVLGDDHPRPLVRSPLTVYLLVAYFQELPADLEEAAKVDGCTTWQAFWKVTVPLSLPGVITTGILTFIFAWSEFLFANTFAFDQTTQPATVVIPNFATQFTTDYGAQAAGAIAVTVPLVLLVLIFQRRIVSGLTAGAVK